MADVRMMLLVVVSLLACGYVLAAAEREPVDLVAALNGGQVWAEFRGAGDRAITGTVGRSEEGPRSINIAPGTQFWAQAGGRQGQINLGNVPVDLQDQRVAAVTFRTCCTNLGLPAATAEDVMIPVACPSPHLAALLTRPGITERPHMAVQAAVWAVVNDARPYEVRKVLRSEKEAGITPAERSRYADTMLTLAADLLRTAGLEPTNYRLFR